MTSDLTIPTGDDAVAVRAQATAARAAAQRSLMDLEEREKVVRSELEQARRDLEAEFARRRAELNAQIGPLKEQLSKLTEVAWTVDLYLGRDEHLVRLRDGESAPAGTPLTIRQRVLSMAEESIILMDAGGDGVDFTTIEHWTQWLLADPANVDRVIPEPKCVVVLVPTRVKSNTDNPWENAARNRLNSESYWLIRNGDKLYLLTVDENLLVGDRLIPKRTEFTEVFEQRTFGGAIQPGSQRWLDLEKKADARRRHYMRIMLILQGLIDRTEVFAPLPATRVNLMSVQAQLQGHVVLVADGDDAILLTDGRPSFDRWQADLCARMRPGMRVVGAFAAHGFDQDRVWPRTVSTLPEDGQPYLIEGRRDGGLVIRYARTDQVWRRDVPVPGRPGYVYKGLYPTQATSRASMVLYPQDWFILPVDLASRADLDYYLNSRTNRSRSFLTMVPAIRSALALKDAEALQEKDFRDLLGAMVEQAGGSRDQVDDLIHRWKVAHVWHRPLCGEPAHEARAARQIMSAFREQARVDGDGVAQKVVEVARTDVNCMAVTACKDGTFRSYARTPQAHDAGVFVDVTRYGKKGNVIEVLTEQVVVARSLATQVELWSSEDWQVWERAANRNHYLGSAEREEATRQAIEATHGEGEVVCVVERFDPVQPTRRMAVYRFDASTQPLPAHDVLGWRNRGSNGVQVTEFDITRTSQGVQLARVAARDALCPRDYGHFSGEGRTLDTPWSDGRWKNVRPRLVFEDVEATAAMVAFAQECRALSDAKRQAHSALRQKADNIAMATFGAVEAGLVALARARFDEDYGPGQDDLWERRHRVKAEERARADAAKMYRFDVLVQCLQAALIADVDPVGMTVNELYQMAVEAGWKDARGWALRPAAAKDRQDVIIEPEQSEGEPH